MPLRGSVVTWIIGLVFLGLVVFLLTPSSNMEHSRVGGWHPERMPQALHLGEHHFVVSPQSDADLYVVAQVNSEDMVSVQFMSPLGRSVAESLGLKSSVLTLDRPSYLELLDRIHGVLMARETAAGMTTTHTHSHGHIHRHDDDHHH